MNPLIHTIGHQRLSSGSQRMRGTPPLSLQQEYSTTRLKYRYRHQGGMGAIILPKLRRAPNISPEHVLRHDGYRQAHDPGRGRGRGDFERRNSVKATRRCPFCNLVANAEHEHTRCMSVVWLQLCMATLPGPARHSIAWRLAAWQQPAPTVRLHYRYCTHVLVLLSGAPLSPQGAYLSPQGAYLCQSCRYTAGLSTSCSTC